MSLQIKLRQILPVVALTIASLAIRLWYAQGFDGLYGQDAYAYYDFAVLIGYGEPLTSFFWGLGYPLLLTAGFSILGASAAVGQLISLIMGAGLTPLVYILARQLGTGWLAALIAGLLMAICGQAIQSSIVLMADIPALFWALLSAVCLLHYVHTLSLKAQWLVLAAMCLALAMLTRWLYLTLIPAFVVLLLVDRSRIRTAHLVVALFATGLLFTPQVIFSMTNPYPVLNHAWVQGWSPANVFSREFVNVDGQFSYEMVNAAFYAMPFYDAYYLAPIFLPFLFLGMLALRRERIRLAFVLAWTLIPFGFLAGIPYQNIRFPLIMSTPIFVLVALGVEHAAKVLNGRRSTVQKAVQYVLIGVVALIGVGMSLAKANQIVSQFVENQMADKEVVAWAAAQLPDGAVVYTMGLTLPLRHALVGRGEVLELYYETPETLDRGWERGWADYLLINVWQIENQWQGREPQIAYHWLRDMRGFRQLGQSGYYTLFRVNE
jgi:4-amino-4-deoxy-L-arabinose transferase-like glycosyltransferase